MRKIYIKKTILFLSFICSLGLNAIAQNTKFGTGALLSNTTGIGNSAFGFDALRFNTIGNVNTAVGGSALSNNTTGSGNVANGVSALFENTTGIVNMASGYMSLNKNTTGSGNVAVGAFALLFNNEGSQNTAIGTQALFGNNGSNNVGIGYRALGSNWEGSYNTAIGHQADVSSQDLTNATAIGANAEVSASNAMVLGSVGVKVGIGTSAPAYQLQLSTNSAGKPGSSTWTIASDKELKKNMTKYEGGIKELNQINPVWFEYNGKAGMPTNERFVGVLADEMKKIAPYTVGTFTYQDTTGKKEEYLSFDANALTYMLINAVKEQQQKIERLEKLVEKLTNQSTSSTSVNLSENKLGQNSPNPTNGTTAFTCTVSNTATKAEIRFSSSTGQLVKIVPVLPGTERVTVNTADLRKGTCNYSLIVDGQIVDTKTMVIQ